MQLRQQAVYQREREVKDRKAKIREEVHEAPSRVTMLNAMLNAAQSWGMSKDVIDRMIRLRAHHNNRYNQHVSALGSMVHKRGAKWIEELVEKYEAELTPDTEADK